MSVLLEYHSCCLLFLHTSYIYSESLQASHGPYANVRDLYKIPGLSSHDIAMFDKYKKELTVLPPGRMFDERINQRQST